MQCLIYIYVNIAMLLNERKIRIYGPIVFGFLLIGFFELPMIFTPQKLSYVFLRVIAATFLWVITIWEPTRFIILKAYHKWGINDNPKKRIIITALILIPVTALIAYGRMLLENQIWKLDMVIRPSFALSYIGTSLIFVIAETAMYETFFYVRKWQKVEIESNELKKMNLQIQYDSLKVQIQPHFLFNTLNTLVGLIKIDVPRAISFTEQMAHVYRYLLEANERQLISVAEETRFIKSYFFMLKTRYSEGLHLEVNTTEEMEHYSLPPLSLQVLLENAVKHNVITKGRPLFIKIIFDPAVQQVRMINNLQPKPSESNTCLGLVHLQNKFDLLHLPKVTISKTTEHFDVTIPLIKSNEI